MYPYVRWLAVLMRNGLRPRPMDLFETSELRFHVWPGDLDFFGHMNNGRFLTLMDSGRFDLMARIGFLTVLRRRRWISVLGGADIRFLRPLRPFQRFALRTRLVGWDDKWFYVAQTFHAKGRVVAEAFVRGAMIESRRRVPTEEALTQFGRATESPPLPEEVRVWAAHQDRAVRSQAV